MIYRYRRSCRFNFTRAHPDRILRQVDSSCDSIGMNNFWNALLFLNNYFNVNFHLLVLEVPILFFAVPPLNPPLEPWCFWCLGGLVSLGAFGVYPLAMHSNTSSLSSFCMMVASSAPPMKQSLSSSIIVFQHSLAAIRQALIALDTGAAAFSPARITSFLQMDCCSLLRHSRSPNATCNHREYFGILVKVHPQLSF